MRHSVRTPIPMKSIVIARARRFAALLGAGVVVAVLAAAGDLGEKHTVTTVDAPTPTAAPTNASNRVTGLTPHQVYEKDAPGVAFVTSTVVQKNESPFGFGESSREGTATGSGIVIDRNGTILTNYHVIENAVKVTVSFEKGKTVEYVICFECSRFEEFIGAKKLRHEPIDPNAQPAFDKPLQDAGVPIAPK